MARLKTLKTTCPSGLHFHYHDTDAQGDHGTATICSSSIEDAIKDLLAPHMQEISNRSKVLAQKEHDLDYRLSLVKSMGLDGQWRKGLRRAIAEKAALVTRHREVAITEHEEEAKALLKQVRAREKLRSQVMTTIANLMAVAHSNCTRTGACLHAPLAVF
jgi:hypothetical protein